MAGLAVAAGAAWRSATAVDRSGNEWLLIVLLAGTLLVISRFPLRFGHGETIISLDSVPLVLAVVLFAPSDAVLLDATAVLWALRNLPGEIGWRISMRVYAFEIARAAIAMTVAAAVVHAIRADGGGAVLLPSALVIAASYELFGAGLFVLDVETREAGAARVILPNMVVPATANVLLPTVAVIALTPYDHDPATLILILALMLVGMYFALWVANSQQLEKRRGEHMRDTFSRYVPEALVGKHFEAMEEVHLGGEQRDVTVLFCDIRGFTSWSENREAVEIITELNVLLTELSAAVMDNDGTLDKYTGDGLMAFWGAPFPQEDHPALACTAALEMLQRLDLVNEVRAADGHEPFAIGVGVHSGLAVVGNVGNEKRLDYTAIGDTVNLTARLEAATKDIGSVLLVSRDTVDRLPNDLRERAMRIGDIRVKGRRQPVEAWALQPLRPEFESLDDLFAA